MKIGVYGGGGLADVRSGGGYTVQANLLQALMRLESNHQFYLICDDTSLSSTCLPVIPLRRYVPQPTDGVIKRFLYKCLRYVDGIYTKRTFLSFLDRAACEHHLDLIWFMTPGYEPVSIPYIYTVWDLQHRRQPYFPEVSVTGSSYDEREKHYKNAISRAAYIITGNEVGKQEIVHFYGVMDERVHIIPLPTPEFALRQPHTAESLAVRPQRPYIMYPAQLWPHKNHMVILLALKELKERHGLDLAVVFTGSDKGNGTYIKRKVQELQLTDRVHFCGFVSIQHLVGLYQNAFALVYASFFGPDNLPPLEACALGCPVICAAFTGAREQLGNAALFFDACDEHALTKQLKELHGSTLLRQALVQQGLELAQGRTSDHYVRAIVMLIDQFASIRRCWSSSERYYHQ